MARVILTCVGSRDPYWGREDSAQLVFSQWKEKHGVNYASASGTQKGPILSFLARINPVLGEGDKLVLISTMEGPRVRDPSVQGGDCTTDEVLKEYPGVKVDHKVLNPQPGGRDAQFNPSLYGEVLPRMRGAVQNVLTGAEEDEYLVIYSSGTPQMQAAWCVLVNAGLLPAKLYRAEGDQVELAPLFEEQAITQAISMVRSGAFRAAAQILHDLEKKALSPARKGLARFSSQICKGYDAWTRFAYEDAQNLIGKAQKGLARLSDRMPSLPAWRDFLSLVDCQQKSLDMCRPGQPALDRILHLLHLAQHESAAGNHQTGLWQYSAVVELVIVDQARQAIEDRYSIAVDPTQYQKSLKGSTQAQWDLYGGNISNVPWWLGDAEALRVLWVLSEEKAKILDEKEVRDLRGWRNALLHRQRQVTDKDTYRAHGIVRRVIKDIYEIDPEDGEHPFSLETMRSATDLMKCLLLGST